MNKPNRPQLSLGTLALLIAVVTVWMQTARIVFQFYYP